ncbi:MAG: NifU family protein [Acidobacteriaceae bacterium]|jgi:Fe-S cluster biogenesis protein NfuA
MATREFSRRTERIEELITRIEGGGDPAMRAVASELLQAVVELHGVALERICQELADQPAGQEAIDRLAEDELVAGVLSLHGIHPQPLEARVAAALDDARPYLQSHGGDVELAGITDGVVRLRLHGACGHCSGSAQTMKSTVEEAIYRSAPEVVSIITEEVAAPAHSELVTLQVS